MLMKLEAQVFNSPFSARPRKVHGRVIRHARAGCSGWNDLVDVIAMDTAEGIICVFVFGRK